MGTIVQECKVGFLLRKTWMFEEKRRLALARAGTSEPENLSLSHHREDNQIRSEPLSYASASVYGALPIEYGYRDACSAFLGTIHFRFAPH